MKHLSLLVLFATPLHGELLATFATTRGNVIVSLHFERAPQTVANFITLAQGTRSRIDPATGAVIRKPLYAGEMFYRVLNDLSGQLAQTGSGTGAPNGGPGYTFRDEIDATLPVGPYRLVMQNEGLPHTNGSQIYFSGANGFPSHIGQNTVFGSITDAPSRAVIDSIIAGGVNTTAIQSIQFQRTSPAALVFNEHAQNLPVCEGIVGHLSVKSGESVIYELDEPQPPGSFVKFTRSINLQSWSPINALYQPTGYSETTQIILDDGSAARAFYHLSNVKHPDALAPDSSLLGGKTLSFTLDGARTMVFNFTGPEGGSFTDSAAAGTAAFTLLSYLPEPYQALFIMRSGALTYRYDCFLDRATATQIAGRCVAYRLSGTEWVSLSSGTLSLSPVP